MMLCDLISGGLFRLCHHSQLIYNTCWEDPRLDRVALRIGPEDHVLVITSGGCNVLDYLLDEPRGVYAVDLNARQNALLELKLAGIRALDFEPFFQLFGRGHLPDWDSLYPARLRTWLSPEAQGFWDAKGWMLCSRQRRGSFYYRGSAGFFAWLMNVYIDRVAKLRGAVDALFAAETLAQQQDIYASSIKPALWGPAIRWLMRRDAVLALLGVPQSQRRQIDRQYPGGIAAYIEDQVEELLTTVPVHDNYFWRVYVSGQYTPDCCPEYLKRENFLRLQAGLVDRVEIHTGSVLDFLRQCPTEISRFTLLDHMDWLYEHRREALQQEWQAIVDRAAPQTRIIWRSAAPHVDFVDPLPVFVAGHRVTVGDLLHYHHELAARLHRQDRVHTYGSFYVADLQKRPGIDAPACTGRRRTHEFAGRLEDAVAVDRRAGAWQDAR